MVVTVPPPSLSLLKGAQYPKKLSMIDLDRHVKNLIVIVPRPQQLHCVIKPSRGSVRMERGTIA